MRISVPYGHAVFAPKRTISSLPLLSLQVIFLREYDYLLRTLATSTLLPYRILGNRGYVAYFARNNPHGLDRTVL